MTADLAVALPISNGVTSEPLDHALMAKAYLSEGRFDEAERLYVLALKVSEEVYGSTHVEVIPHLENSLAFISTELNTKKPDLIWSVFMACWSIPGTVKSIQ